MISVAGNDKNQTLYPTDKVPDSSALQI